MSESPLEVLRADAGRLRDQADALMIGLGDENLEDREARHAQLTVELEALKDRVGAYGPPGTQGS